MSRSPVVITGIGVVSSIGIGHEAFFSALLKGKSGIRWLSEREDEHAKPNSARSPGGVWAGAPVLDFNAKEYVRPRKALKVMCREIQLSFAASVLAIEHAGLTDSLPASDDSEISPDRIGTVFGGEMLFGPPAEMADTIIACQNENGEVDGSQFGNAARKNVMPLWMLKYLPNMPACHVGISINALGPNNSIVVGDVSGPAALIESQSCLQRGIADIMISGSVGTRINTTRMHSCHDLPIPEIDPSFGDEQIRWLSRPYAEDSTGVIGGEASVTLVVESENSATDRGAKPIARVAGTASRFVAADAITNKSRSNDINPKFSRGSRKAIELAIAAALHDAGKSVEEIGLVVSHASGDPENDGAERQALESLGCTAPMTAPMASIGHTGAASGSIAIATGALALSQKVAPPTAGDPNGGDLSNRHPQLFSKIKSLKGECVLCVSHTSEGSATAIVLTS